MSRRITELCGGNSSETSTPNRSGKRCGGRRSILELGKGSSIIVIIFTSVHSVRWGGGGQGRPYAFLNVVYSDGN